MIVEDCYKEILELIIYKEFYDKVSAEEAIYIDNSEYILLKLSNEFSEVNIYFPKDNIQEFKDFITEKTQYIKLGFILGYSVMWKRKNSDIYLLIGDDESTWDVCFIMDKLTMLDILNEIEGLL